MNFDIYGFCNSLSGFENEFISGEEYSEILQDIQRGDFKFDYGKLVNKFGKFIGKDIKDNAIIIVQVIIIALLTGFLGTMKSSFASEGVSEITFYICYLVIVTLITSGFVQIVQIASEAINQQTMFMQTILPVLISFMISTGGIVSSSMIYPIIVFVSEALANFMNNFMLPIITTAFAIGIISNISDKINISKISNTIKGASLWILGILLTVFTGIVSLEGSIASTVDGVTIKTAKFMFSNSIPVVGKILGDSVDTILGSTLILKDAIGFLGIILLLAIVMTPIIKIITLILIYTGASILVQPFSEKRVGKFLQETVDASKIVLGVTSAVAVIFIIGIVSILKMSNSIAMFR